LHCLVLISPSSTLAAHPSELADDQDHEEDRRDTHEHPDAPQEIEPRCAHSHGSRSSCGSDHGSLPLRGYEAIQTAQGTFVTYVSPAELRRRRMVSGRSPTLIFTTGERTLALRDQTHGRIPSMDRRSMNALTPSVKW